MRGCVGDISLYTTAGQFSLLLALECGVYNSTSCHSPSDPDYYHLSGKGDCELRESGNNPHNEETLPSHQSHRGTNDIYIFKKSTKNP